MKKIYIITIAIVLLVIFLSLLFVDIPSPSKFISENYNLNIK